MNELFGIPLDTLLVVLVVALAAAAAAIGVLALRNPVLVRLGVRNVGRRRGRSALIVVGLMLGTTIIAAALTTGDTMSHTIRATAIEALGATDEVISARGAAEDIPGELGAATGMGWFDEDAVEAVEAKVDGTGLADGVTGAIVEQLAEQLPHAAHEIFDPATGTWTRGPDLPTARSGLTAGVLNGHVHVTGGESLSPGRTFGEHEAYDPTTATWTALASLPTPRHGLASAVVGGRWYVIGGGTRAGAMTFISLSDLVEVFPGRPEGAE